MSYLVVLLRFTKMKTFHIRFSVFLALTVLHQSQGFSLNLWSEDNDSFGFQKIMNPDLTGPYKTCKIASYGRMANVEVEPCQGSERCPLIRGTNVTLSLEFIPTMPASNVKGSLAGVYSMLSIPFGKPEDLCASKQIECPLVPWKVYRFRTTVFVRRHLPKVRLDTKVLIHTLDGNEKREIACAIIPVEIVDPSQHLQPSLPNDYPI